ncbi:phosphatase PAP2 family protein [Bradyrhizobium brasilense]|nr:phosphatase PAP2 family protein [Bradyrhizobium brasilense]
MRIFPARTGRSQGNLNELTQHGGMTTTDLATGSHNANDDALRGVLWAPVLLFLAGCFAAFHWSGFRHVDVNWAGYGGMAAILLSAYLVTKGLRIRFVQLFINCWSQNLVVAIAATMLTYAAATVGRPLMDDQLLRADQLIGYDWRAYAGFFAGSGTMVRIVSEFYNSIFYLPNVVILALAIKKDVKTLEKFILAAIISLLLTIGIFALVPATTAWTHLHLSDTEISSFRNLPLSSDGWIDELIRIREGSLRSLRNFQGKGLIAFPSFHCAAALILIWASWNILWLRIPMTLVNLGMILATPIVGGHYVTDLIGGLVITIVSVILAGWLHTWMLRHVAVVRRGAWAMIPAVQRAEPRAEVR